MKKESWKICETEYPFPQKLLGVFYHVDEPKFEGVIIGEITPINRIRAEIICAALNADSRTK